MNIFSINEFSSIKTKCPQIEGGGYFYFIDFGESVKIGCSQNPFNRIYAIRSNAEKYGKQKIIRCFVSDVHSNYKANEKVLHRRYADLRKPNTELFDISFDFLLSEYHQHVEYEQVCSTNTDTKPKEELIKEKLDTVLPNGHTLRECAEMTELVFNMEDSKRDYMIVLVSIIAKQRELEEQGHEYGAMYMKMIRRYFESLSYLVCDTSTKESLASRQAEKK